MRNAAQQAQASGLFLKTAVVAPNPSVAELIRNAETGSAKPSSWQGLLASFYGALDEEILIRLGLMSLVALAFRTMARILGADRELALPTGVFWAPNIVTAVIFASGGTHRLCLRLWGHPD